MGVFLPIPKKYRSDKYHHAILLFDETLISPVCSHILCLITVKLGGKVFFCCEEKWNMGNLRLRSIFEVSQSGSSDPLCTEQQGDASKNCFLTVEVQTN